MDGVEESVSLKLTKTDPVSSIATQGNSLHLWLYVLSIYTIRFVYLTQHADVIDVVIIGVRAHKSVAQTRLAHAKLPLLLLSTWGRIRINYFRETVQTVAK